MSKKSTLIISLSSILITLIGVLLFVIAGPFISLQGIQSNLEKEKIENLEAYIDFPLLQENIKVKIRKQAQSALGLEFTESNNMLAQLAMQFANQLVDVAVENAVSPAGIAMILSGKDLNELMFNKNNEMNENIAGNKETQLADKSIIDLYKANRFDYVSHREFIFYIPGEDVNAEQGELVFTRKGIFWKLTDVTFIQKISF